LTKAGPCYSSEACGQADNFFIRALCIKKKKQKKKIKKKIKKKKEMNEEEKNKKKVCVHPDRWVLRPPAWRPRVAAAEDGVYV
jgi:hypothetical protein